MFSFAAAKEEPMDLSEKQIHILEVAEALFAEKGFDGTSVRQIAKEAGVNVAMISYYFGSKEKMLSALINYKAAGFRIAVESVLSEDDGFLEKTDAIVKLLVQRIHKNRRMYKIIHFEFSNLDRQLDFENYVNRKKENYKLIKDFVAQGQEAGVFSRKVEVSLVGPTILGTYFNFYYNKKFFHAVHQLPEEMSFDEFLNSHIIPHIQRTIKALLTYED